MVGPWNFWNFVLANGTAAATWSVWLLQDRQARPLWRRLITVAGISLVSANVGAVWWMIVTQTSLIPLWTPYEDIPLYGLAGAVVCAVLGKGNSRGWIVVSAVFGVCIWLLAFSPSA